MKKLFRFPRSHVRFDNNEWRLLPLCPLSVQEKGHMSGPKNMVNIIHSPLDLMYRSVLVFYCCITNYHIFSNLKQYSLSHSSVGQKFSTLWLDSVARISLRAAVLIWGSGSCSKLTSSWKNSSQASCMASSSFKPATGILRHCALISSGFLFYFLFGFYRTYVITLNPLRKSKINSLL